MMSIRFKRIKESFLVAALPLLLAGCSQRMKVSVEGLDPEQAKAVEYVADHIEVSQQLVAYSLVEGELSAAVEADRFKSTRDAVNKLLLDRRAADVRGLQSAYDKFTTELEGYAEAIRAAANDGGDNARKYLIVLATVKNASDREWSLIVAFEPQVTKAAAWIPVTKPVQNTAFILINAQNGELLDRGFEKPSAEEIEKTDPVTRFISEADPL